MSITITLISMGNFAIMQNGAIYQDGFPSYAAAWSDYRRLIADTGASEVTSMPAPVARPTFNAPVVSKDNTLLADIRSKNPLFKKITVATTANITNIMGQLTTIKGIHDRDDVPEELKNDVNCMTKAELTAMSRYISKRAVDTYQLEYGRHAGNALYNVAFLKAMIIEFVVSL